MERSEEILDRAVGLPSESQEPWDCVVALHRRGDAATFHAAAEFLRSSDPTRRVLAVDVLAVETLIDLSADEDAHVRDWATFGLATQIDRDDHVLRSALIARLDDPDDATRDEALRGLATRGDSRAIPQLLHELGGAAAREDPGTLQEALLALASRTADGRPCARVDAMEQEWMRDCADDALPTALHSAVEACRHAERRGR